MVESLSALLVFFLASRNAPSKLATFSCSCVSLEFRFAAFLVAISASTRCRSSAARHSRVRSSAICTRTRMSPRARESDCRTDSLLLSNSLRKPDRCPSSSCTSLLDHSMVFCWLTKRDSISAESLDSLWCIISICSLSRWLWSASNLRASCVSASCVFLTSSCSSAEKSVREDIAALRSP